MGNSQTTEYSFQNQFYVLEDSFPTDTLYKLQSKQTEELLIGRQIQTLSKDDTYQLECIIKQLQANPSPFCIKLLHATKINQNAYCSSGSKFYLLFPWVNTLGHALEGGATYSLKEVDIMIGRVCKALKYIYGINHEHGFVSPYSVMYPSFCLIDKWAIKGTGGGNGREGRDGKDDKEGRMEKYAGDLYAVGEIAKRMMERVNKKESEAEGCGVVDKMSVLMGERMRDRFDIYAVLDIKDQHRPKHIHQHYDSNKSATNLTAHQIPVFNHNNPISRPTNIQNFQESQVIKGNMVNQNVMLTYPSHFGVPQTINPQQSTNLYKANTNATTDTTNKNYQFNQTSNPQKEFKITHNVGSSSQIFIPAINNTGGQLKHQPNYRVYPNVSSSFHTPSISTKAQFTKLDSLPKVSNLSLSIAQQHPIPLTHPMRPAFEALPLQKIGDSALGTQQSIQFMKDLDKMEQAKNKMAQNLHDESSLFTPSDFYQRVREQSATKTVNVSLFNPDNTQTPSIHNNIASAPNSQTRIVSPTTNNAINDHSLSISPKQPNESMNIDHAEEIINLQVNNPPLPHSPPTPLKDPLLKQEPQQAQQQQNEREEYEEAERVPIFDRMPPVTVIPELSEQSGGEEEDREFVVEKYQNGSRYEGYKFNGMRDGEGKFTYQQGSYYTGFWKKNNMHGFGRLYYPNQKLAYEGNWFVDQFHGNGKVFNDEPVEIEGYFDYTNFEQMGQKWLSYEGTLVCDSKEGYGKLMLSNGEYYVGNFEGDRVSGEGVFVAKDRSIKGIWKDSRLVKIL